MKRVKIFDVFLTVFLFLITIFFSIKFFFVTKSDERNLLIETPTENYTYTMPVDKVLTVIGVRGETIIEIKGNKFRFVESACKNKDCVKNGWVSLPFYPVVCLPNRVSAYIETKKEIEIDGVSR